MRMTNAFDVEGRTAKVRKAGRERGGEDTESLHASRLRCYYDPLLCSLLPLVPGLGSAERALERALAAFAGYKVELPCCAAQDR